jgi:hypothetical protein
VVQPLATSQPAQPSAEQRPTEDTEPKPLRRPATRSWRIQVETEANRLELDLQASIDALASDEPPRYEVIDEIRWQLFRARCIARNRIGVDRRQLKPSRDFEPSERHLMLREGVVRLPPERPPTLWARLVELWNGADVEAARAALHRAREALLLVQPSDAVLAQLPTLRAALQARLRVTDPRRQSYLRALDAITERAMAAETDDDAARPRGAAHRRYLY